MRDLYSQLVKSPPQIQIAENATEMKIHLVSVMCDNKYMISMTRFTTGWQLNTRGQAFHNFQMKCYQYEIEWAADAKDWSTMTKLLNSGTSVIEKIVSR